MKITNKNDLMKILRKGVIDNGKDFWTFVNNAEKVSQEDYGMIIRKEFRVSLDFLDYDGCFCEIEIRTIEQLEDTVILTDSADVRFFNDEYVEFDSLEELERYMKILGFRNDKEEV